MDRKIILIISLVMSLASNLFTQEQLGLRGESYSGVNSLLLNPANGPSSSFSWDVNVASAGIFFESNYGYLQNTNVPEILRLLPEVAFAADFNSERDFPENTLIADYYDNGRRKFVSAQTDIMGPSFMINLESGHSFGLFTRFRSAVSSQNIPGELNYYFFDRTPTGQEINVDPFSVAAMAWSEVGINYAVHMPTDVGNLDVGVSIKFLQGYEGFYFDSKKSFGLTQLGGDSLNFNLPDFALGFTNTNATGEYNGLTRNGGGIGIDLGMVYTIDGDHDLYLWKFGASLMDIGRVNFKKNAQKHRFALVDMSIIDPDDYRDMEDVEDILTLLSSQFLDSSTESQDGGTFGIWLPGALSLQADFHPIPMFYVGGLIVQRLPYQKAAIKRDNLIALTPRFEHRWFGAMMPISLYNYRNINLGLSLRLGFLTIGSDNLGSFVGRSNVTGSDFYVGLKVNPFKVYLGGGGGGNGWKRGKNVKCYQF